MDQLRRRVSADAVQHARTADCHHGASADCWEYQCFSYQSELGCHGHIFTLRQVGSGAALPEAPRAGCEPGHYTRVAFSDEALCSIIWWPTSGTPTPKQTIKPDGATSARAKKRPLRLLSGQGREETTRFVSCRVRLCCDPVHIGGIFREASHVLSFIDHAPAG